MISSVRGVFRPFWAILANLFKETKVRESPHTAYWAPGIERLYTSRKRSSFASSQSNQTELKRHFDRLCPGWLQFPQRRTRTKRLRRGRPCGAAATPFLPRFSLAKHIGGNNVSSSSISASAGSWISSSFKTSAASMNFAARNHGFFVFLHAPSRCSKRSAFKTSAVNEKHGRVSTILGSPYSALLQD